MTQRVIKFRYLWKHDGTGKIVSKEYELSDIQNWLVEYPDHTIRWDIIARLQFTGLTDKHGKEIYEKDLIRWHDDIFRVEYDGGGFKGENVTQNIPGYLSWEHFSASEKVGDAYTTPELVDPKMIEHGNS